MQRLAAELRCGHVRLSCLDILNAGRPEASSLITKVDVVALAELLEEFEERDLVDVGLRKLDLLAVEFVEQTPPAPRPAVW